MRFVVHILVNFIEVKCSNTFCSFAFSFYFSLEHCGIWNITAVSQLCFKGNKHLPSDIPQATKGELTEEMTNTELIKD